ncbi:MAG: alpha/beta fold hydrolase [Microthrixaceae bacterium]|nr:alpha/beta fold hydrolase [Microthrixaceae bacterium]
MTADVPPVVLVHGLATSAERTWVETGFTELLADEGRRVSLVDLPGHGASPLLASGEWDRLDDWLSAQLPDGPIDAVGFSMGARLLLTLAGSEPSRFRRLVVAGVGANLFHSQDRSPLSASLEAGEDPEDNPILRHFHELTRASGTEPAAVQAILDARLRPLEPLMGSITAEVLVVLGETDFVGPADPLVERLPAGSRLETLGGVDHFATPKSIGFIDASLRFLNRP